MGDTASPVASLREIKEEKKKYQKNKSELLAAEQSPGSGSGLAGSVLGVGFDYLCVQQRRDAARPACGLLFPRHTVRAKGPGRPGWSTTADLQPFFPGAGSHGGWVVKMDLGAETNGRACN